MTCETFTFPVTICFSSAFASLTRCFSAFRFRETKRDLTEYKTEISDVNSLPYADRGVFPVFLKKKKKVMYIFLCGSRCFGAVVEIANKNTCNLIKL